MQSLDDATQQRIRQAIRAKEVQLPNNNHHSSLSGLHLVPTPTLVAVDASEQGGGGGGGVGYNAGRVAVLEKALDAEKRARQVRLHAPVPLSIHPTHAYVHRRLMQSPFAVYPSEI